MSSRSAVRSSVPIEKLGIGPPRTHIWYWRLPGTASDTSSAAAPRSEARVLAPFQPAELLMAPGVGML